MELDPLDLPRIGDAPVRKSARRLRWFKKALYRQVEALSEQSGIAYLVDDAEVRALFLRWLEAFEAQKPASLEDRADFVNFASGLMLRELLRANAVTSLSLPEGADRSKPVYYWPEGYLYVMLCLTIRAAIFRQDFAVETAISSANREDLRTWWSFKENMETEDLNLAIGFLELFAGVTPDWNRPNRFSAGSAEPEQPA